MTVPQDAPSMTTNSGESEKSCHPERPKGVEGSSHRFDHGSFANAKILRRASLAQDDKAGDIHAKSPRFCGNGGFYDQTMIYSPSPVTVRVLEK